MRHFLILTTVTVLLAGAYYWSQSRVFPVGGRVLMHDVDGREVGVAGAKVRWYPAGVVEQQLRAWLDSYEGWRRENELPLRAARNEWNQKVAARDEAAGILRIAESANSADLGICRARHREAAADAEDALRKLEKLASGADEAADPAHFLAGLPPASVGFLAGEDGRFSFGVPEAGAGYVVASIEQSGRGKETLVWLRAMNPGEPEQIQFSNANVLTTENLVKLARDLMDRTMRQSPTSG
jgi:hypothetical protein